MTDDTLTSIFQILKQMTREDRPYMIYPRSDETRGKDKDGFITVEKHRSATVITPKLERVVVEAEKYITYPNYLGTEMLKERDKMQRHELGELIVKILIDMD